MEILPASFDNVPMPTPHVFRYLSHRDGILQARTNIDGQVNVVQIARRLNLIPITVAIDGCYCDYHVPSGWSLYPVVGGLEISNPVVLSGQKVPTFLDEIVKSLLDDIRWIWFCLVKKFR